MDDAHRSGDPGGMGDGSDRVVDEVAPAGRRRTAARALFRRLLVINGLVFTAGTLVLALSPATVSSPVLLAEIPVLGVGLAAIVAANALLVRNSLAPLASLTSVMARVNLLHPGDRLTAEDSGDLTQLVSTFNSMLDRLEAEHSASSARTLAAQESERQRIAQELHDEIGQSLTVVLLGLKRVLDQAPDELREEISSVQETVRQSLDEVRQVARRLRPGVLDDLGLVSALNALATDFTQGSGVAVVHSMDPVPPPIQPDLELVVYRVAQESLTNVARHAAASRAELSLTATDDELRLRVADDGKGGEHLEGMGIQGMRERAMLVGGRVTVEAGAAGGTTVSLVVPRTSRRGRIT